jgi:hypothetical protein
MKVLLPFFILLVPFLAGVFAEEARRRLVCWLVAAYVLLLWVLHLYFEVVGFAEALATVNFKVLASGWPLFALRLPFIAVPVGLAFALGRLLGWLLTRLRRARA